MEPASYHSFLVRLWREPPAAGGSWRGEVEVIQRGHLVPVQSLDEALALIRRAVESDPPLVLAEPPPTSA